MKRKKGKNEKVNQEFTKEKRKNITTKKIVYLEWKVENTHILRANLQSPV